MKESRNQGIKERMNERYRERLQQEEDGNVLVLVPVLL